VQVFNTSVDQYCGLKNLLFLSLMCTSFANLVKF
jgi:hypothetical protein